MSLINRPSIILNKLLPSFKIFYGINALRYKSSGPLNNFQIKETITNRNPRNLQLMLIERKPKGFQLDYPSREYWYRLHFNVRSRDILCSVVHNSGVTVVKVNSQEWAIEKQLYSLKSLSAVENLARILAQRCFETGIHFVQFEIKTSEKKSPKLQLFLDVLEEEGLKIGELKPIEPRTRVSL